MKNAQVLSAVLIGAVVFAHAPGAQASSQLVDVTGGSRVVPFRLEKGDWREKEAQGYRYYRLGDFGAFSAREGSLQLRVRRTADQGANYFPLVEFVGGDGEVAAGVMIQWEDVTVPRVGKSAARTASLPEEPKSIVYLRGPNWDVWGKRNRMDRQVQPGEEVLITLTWGADPSSNRIYINDREVPSYRTPSQEESPRKGSLARYLGGIGHFRLPDVGALAPLSPEERAFDLDTKLVEVVIHDRPLTAADLSSASNVQVASVSHNASRVAGFSGRLIAGDRLEVAAAGTPGAAASFGIAHYPDLSGTIALDWRGWGVYLEEKAFFKDTEVNLRDVEGYRVYVGTEPPGVPTAETVAAEELEVGEQSVTLEGLEADTPYFVAVYALKRDGTFLPVLRPLAGIAMAEAEPGKYAGAHVVGYADRLARAVVVARLEQGGEAAVAVAPGDPIVVDPRLKVAVSASPEELEADEKSTSKVTVTVSDANGNPVSGHEVRFVLATTSQYTGVVGGGAFAEQVGGTIKADFRGVTDLFGRVTGTYVAGFAAKTAVIVARDMASNDTGAGWVKTYIRTRAELELEPVEPVAAMAAGYAIEVTSSDAWLTADGRSTARITARVTLAGAPVEGHKVGFAVSGVGSIRTVRDTTDGRGEARAVYTAGKKIGIVLVTATDLTAGISGSVPIELRSDAPAKIAIKLDPEKLPADGRSRAELTVTVTDINDNPNDNVEVEYAIVEGGGRLRRDRGTTDRRGEHANEYTAGRTPGRVGIEITVRSTVPTAEELGKARELALAVTDYEFF